METSAKELYVTFDDGPVSGPTEFMLETLRKANAQGTFFCIGENIKKHPELFRKVVASGHTIGNHTFNHLSGWKTNTQSYLHNVKLCEHQIKVNSPSSTQPLALGAEHPVSSIQYPAYSKPLFRPPYGRITRGQIKSLVELKIVMWDVLTHDYAKSLSPGNCLKGSIAATRPGSIVVFHDSLKAEKNMAYVLPRYLDHFANQGYTFKSLR